MIFQFTVTGVAGLMFLDVLIPVVEVQIIVSGCVTIHVRAVEVVGVLETQQNFKDVTQRHVQVSII